jgi:serine/threonine-protein kinase
VQSDLYSVGVILYEALAGTRPFAGDTPMSLCMAVHQGDHEPLAARCPGLDPGLAAVVERAMALRPEDRFATAAEMAAALAGTAIPAPPPDADPTISVGDGTRVLDQAPLPAAAPAAPVAPLRTRSSRPVVLITAGLCLLAAWLILGGRGGESAPPADAQSPAPSTAPAAGAGIPAPLNDALTDLEEMLR